MTRTTGKRTNNRIFTNKIRFTEKYLPKTIENYRIKVYNIPDG